MSRVPRALSAAWFEVDPRALGVLRVSLGLVALVDVLRRLADLRLYYTAEGVWPAAVAQANLPGPYTFSPLFAFDQPGPVAAFFVATALCLVALVLGWRTRLFHVLGVLGVLAIHARNVLIENQGDIALVGFLVWSLFLPLGLRYSLDARRRGEAPTAPVRSLAVFALRVQIAVVYLFNAVHKDGFTWSEGSAIHYALHLDTKVRAWAVALRDAPLWLSQAMSWGALVIEWAAPLLILAPRYAAATRGVAIASLCALHLGIFALLDVGLYSFVMIASFPILLHRRHFGPPVEAAPRRGNPWVVEVACAVLMLIATLQTLQDNGLATFTAERPAWMRAIVEATRTYQGWSQFAANPPLRDGWLVIDAVTTDGRHLDPQTGAPPAFVLPDARQRSFGQFWAKYTQRAPGDPVVLDALGAWITGPYPHRGLAEGERFLGATVWWIADRPPKPGEGTAPFETERRVVARSGVDQAHDPQREGAQGEPAPAQEGGPADAAVGVEAAEEGEEAARDPAAEAEHHQQ